MTTNIIDKFKLDLREIMPKDIYIKFITAKESCNILVTGFYAINGTVLRCLHPVNIYELIEYKTVEENYKRYLSELVEEIVYLLCYVCSKMEVK